MLLGGAPSKCRGGWLLHIICWDTEKGKEEEEMVYSGRTTNITIDCEVSCALSESFFVTSGCRRLAVTTARFLEVGLRAQEALYYISCFRRDYKSLHLYLLHM